MANLTNAGFACSYQIDETATPVQLLTDAENWIGAGLAVLRALPLMLDSETSIAETQGLIFAALNNLELGHLASTTALAKLEAAGKHPAPAVG